MENIEFINIWSRKRTSAELALAFLLCRWLRSTLTAANVTRRSELHMS